MTRTEWFVNVLIPEREAVAAIEEEPTEIYDLIEKIERGELIHVNRQF